jgi:hypothetical protein
VDVWLLLHVRIWTSLKTRVLCSREIDLIDLRSFWSFQLSDEHTSTVITIVDELFSIYCTYTRTVHANISVYSNSLQNDEFPVILKFFPSKNSPYAKGKFGSLQIHSETNQSCRKEWGRKAIYCAIMVLFQDHEKHSRSIQQGKFRRLGKFNFQ